MLRSDFVRAAQIGVSLDDTDRLVLLAIAGLDALFGQFAKNCFECLLRIGRSGQRIRRPPSPLDLFGRDGGGQFRRVVADPEQPLLADLRPDGNEVGERKNVKLAQKPSQHLRRDSRDEFIHGQRRGVVNRTDREHTSTGRRVEDHHLGTALVRVHSLRQ